MRRIKPAPNLGRNQTETVPKFRASRPMLRSLQFLHGRLCARAGAIGAARAAPNARAAAQIVLGGAKKQRRDPSGRLQRQNWPSCEGCASLKGMTSSGIESPTPAVCPTMA